MMGSHSHLSLLSGKTKKELEGMRRFWSEVYIHSFRAGSVPDKGELPGEVMRIWGGGVNWVRRRCGRN